MRKDSLNLKVFEEGPYLDIPVRNKNLEKQKFKNNQRKCLIYEKRNKLHFLKKKEQEKEKKFLIVDCNKDVSEIPG